MTRARKKLSAWQRRYRDDPEFAAAERRRRHVNYWRDCGMPLSPREIGDLEYESWDVPVVKRG
jgi:hypothetical protein